MKCSYTSTVHDYEVLRNKSIITGPTLLSDIEFYGFKPDMPANHELNKMERLLRKTLLVPSIFDLGIHFRAVTVLTGLDTNLLNRVFEEKYEFTQHGYLYID